MKVSGERARDVFVSLADTLVDEFDIIDFLDMLSARCVELLGVAAAGVLLVDNRGTLNLVAGSTEQARMLQLCQLQHGEGPCVDCHVSGQYVTCLDVADAAERWPRFAPVALGAGFAGVHALPMRLRADVLGGLDLFTRSPGTLAGEHVALGQALADMATIGILHERAVRYRDLRVEQLQTALDSRIVIEQAKGVLAERLHIPVADAFTLLRNHARGTSRRMIDLAATIVAGSADIAEITGDTERSGGSAEKAPE